MLLPASPAGWPQPIIRSSIWRGSSSGTLSRAARTICAARSSGRMLTIEPLPARPIGERATETMTASGMRYSFEGYFPDVATGPRTVSVTRGESHVEGHGARRHGFFGRGDRCGAGPAAAQLGEPAPRPLAAAEPLGTGDLGAGTCGGLSCCLLDRLD